MTVSEILAGVALALRDDLVAFNVVFISCFGPGNGLLLLIALRRMIGASNRIQHTQPERNHLPWIGKSASFFAGRAWKGKAKERKNSFLSPAFSPIFLPATTYGCWLPKNHVRRARPLAGNSAVLPRPGNISALSPQRICQSGRHNLRLAKPARQAGVDVGKPQVGLDEHGKRQLASCHLDVPFAGRPVVRLGPDGPPRHERPAACPQHRAAFPAVAKDDRRALAQFRGGGLIRTASVAGGIGGLDFREKGRVEHVLLDTGDVGLCPLRGQFQISNLKSQIFLRIEPGAFRARIAVQIHGGDAALCAAAAGLLALAPVGADAGQTAFVGESPFSHSGGGGFDGDLRGAAARRLGHPGGYAGPIGPAGQRGGFLRALPWQDRMAGGSVRGVSASRTLAGWNGGGSGDIIGRCHGAGSVAVAGHALAGGGVVLVSGHAGAGHWFGASWPAGHGGSLHLHSVHRAFCGRRLGSGQADGTLAQPGNYLLGGHGGRNDCLHGRDRASDALLEGLNNVV